MSYEFYKILHIFSIVLFYCGMAVSFYGNAPKHLKIISGVSSFLILVAGMGLLKFMGIAHGEGFPSWVWGKMGIWLFLAVGAPIAAKRLPENARQPALYVGLVLLILAHFLAVTKPV